MITLKYGYGRDGLIEDHVTVGGFADVAAANVALAEAMINLNARGLGIIYAWAKRDGESVPLGPYVITLGEECGPTLQGDRAPYRARLMTVRPLEQGEEAQG